MIGCPKILLVDDEKNMLTTLADILDLMGYETLLANDGAQAIELVTVNRVDLALLDFKMPGLNGVETFKELKKIVPEIKAIFITAYYDETIVNEIADEGLIAVCHKPINIPMLLDHIKAATGEN